MRSVILQASDSIKTESTFSSQSIFPYYLQYIPCPVIENLFDTQDIDAQDYQLKAGIRAASLPLSRGYLAFCYTERPPSWSARGTRRLRTQMGKNSAMILKAIAIQLF